MTSRKTIDQITSDELDQLHNDLDAALDRAATAAGQRDRLTHRVRNLADQWATTRPDAAAELRELLTLEDRASGADEPARTTPNNPTTSNDTKEN